MDELPDTILPVKMFRQENAKVAPGLASKRFALAELSVVLCRSQGDVQI